MQGGYTPTTYILPLLVQIQPHAQTRNMHLSRCVYPGFHVHIAGCILFKWLDTTLEEGAFFHSVRFWNVGNIELVFWLGE